MSMKSIMLIELEIIIYTHFCGNYNQNKFATAIGKDTHLLLVVWWICARSAMSIVTTSTRTSCYPPCAVRKIPSYGFPVSVVALLSSAAQHILRQSPQTRTVAFPHLDED